MKLNESQQFSKDVKFIIEKFEETPGRFASIVIQMYWATKDECDSYKQERDSLITDITRLRAERDEYKRKLDDVVELFTRHINYKLSVSHNTWYLGLRHKLDEVLKDER
ncbi:hypothetical protein MTQ94_06375 [Staphylococcus agnetis]|uniref:hypothetical protein n=1 Tax=Staphylococcus agnetis TaxID=985762 RepID=UPI00208F9769|nr:hypothetical protein [Staphylococcus agnetis]MCO4341421.1 hypothetical protein [Staphylococcus agnetis]MCO4343408.1 hypothetical protein [Staphylococcus agnetis]MCO4350791.1 hypothetical protein [Staphylococcus agnetis]MCO4353431.1 hypothetical protein [Staphylococcus agnetis]MCO4367406.1 hypothetical protein [Staphylococcus agnetis]